MNKKLSVKRHQNYINGEWAPPEGGDYYTTHNPAHPRKPVGEFPASGISDMDAALEAASAAQEKWSGTPGPQRSALLLRFADLLEKSKQELGHIITLEMGKALAESVGEVGRAVAETRFMAGEACRPTGEVFPSEKPGINCRTVREPIGVIASITPWNFPVVSPVRKIAPALAYGNTMVCKPASQTPWCCVFMMSLLQEAGIPPGVINLVLGQGASVGDALVNDPRVKGISFTGSSGVGTQLYESAARRLAAVQLELGGKNPALVLECDDLEGAAREIVSAAFLCSGQRCTALSRVVVLEPQADQLVRLMTQQIERIRVGDGLDAHTTMGPLATAGQFRTVERYVQSAMDEGASLITGGKALTSAPESEGFYYAPTLFDQVSSHSSIAKEEVFGPVLPVIRVPTTEEAIAVANDTIYGLAASVFTQNPRIAADCTRQIDTGIVHLNHGTASQAHIPFGGRKSSGQGAFSIGATSRDFFTSIKTVYDKW